MALSDESQEKQQLRDALIALLHSEGWQNKDISNYLGNDLGIPKCAPPTIGRIIEKMYKSGALKTDVRFSELMPGNTSLMDDVLGCLTVAREWPAAKQKKAKAYREDLSARVIVEYKSPGMKGICGGVGAVAALQLIRYLEERKQLILKKQKERDLEKREKGQTLIGVSWGSHVAAMIRWLGRFLEYGQPHHRMYENVTVFPVSGDIVSAAPDFGLESFESTTHDVQPLRLLCSDLCQQLCSVLGAKQLVQYTGPGWLPCDREDNQEQLEKNLATAQSFLRQYEGYRRVFEKLGTSGSLLQEAHVVITGIGSRKTFVGMLEATERVHPDLKGASGDISGIPLNKNGPMSTEAARRLEQTVIGYKLADLQHVAEKASETPNKKGKLDRRLGVLAITSGSDRAVPARAAWQGKLVNVLCCDSIVASEVRKSL